MYLKFNILTGFSLSLSQDSLSSKQLVHRRAISDCDMVVSITTIHSSDLGLVTMHGA